MLSMNRLLQLLVLATAYLALTTSLQFPLPRRSALVQRPASTPIRSSPLLETPNGGDQPKNTTPASSFLPWRALLAETLGTFWIVQIGTGAVMSAIFTSSLQSLWQIAVVWMLAIASAICVTAPISGAHLNPAITLSLALFRKFSWKQVLPYSLAQVVGATLASGVNYGLYAHLIRDFEAAQSAKRVTCIASAKVFGEYFGSTPRVVAFCAEALGTALLAAVVFALTHPRNKETSQNVPVPLMIGGTVAALICVLGPLTQAGFNPARDFGPRLVAYLAGWTQVAFQGAWLYIVAPLLGAPLGAALVDKVLFATDDEETSKNGGRSVNGDTPLQ